MFGPKENITVKIKLYGGLDRQSNLANYDPESGIDLKISKGARLKKVILMLGLRRHEPVVYFINGKKAGLNQKVNDKDVIFFMKPVSGG
jgi:molybdopterin converting factor small subunit